MTGQKVGDYLSQVCSWWLDLIGVLACVILLSISICVIVYVYVLYINTNIYIYISTVYFTIYIYIHMLSFLVSHMVDAYIYAYIACWWWNSGKSWQKKHPPKRIHVNLMQNSWWIVALNCVDKWRSIVSLSTSTFFLTVASPLTGKLTSACPFKTCGPATGIAALLVCGVRECIASTFNKPSEISQKFPRKVSISTSVRSGCEWQAIKKLSRSIYSCRNLGRCPSLGPEKSKVWSSHNFSAGPGNFTHQHTCYLSS